MFGGAAGEHLRRASHTAAQRPRPTRPAWIGGKWAISDIGAYRRSSRWNPFSKRGRAGRAACRHACDRVRGMSDWNVIFSTHTHEVYTHLLHAKHGPFRTHVPESAHRGTRAARRAPPRCSPCRRRRPVTSSAKFAKFAPVPLQGPMAREDFRNLVPYPRSCNSCNHSF